MKKPIRFGILTATLGLAVAGASIAVADPGDAPAAAKHAKDGSGKERGKAHGEKARRGGHRAKNPMARFSRADANHDGFLTKDEVGERWDRVSKADANGDGKVSREEMKAAFKAKRKEKAEHRFDRADKNGNGVLTKDEVGEQRWSRLVKADANGDGKVSKSELQRAMKDRKAKKKDAPRGPEAKGKSEDSLATGEARAAEAGARAEAHAANGKARATEAGAQGKVKGQVRAAEARKNERGSKRAG